MAKNCGPKGASKPKGGGKPVPAPFAPKPKGGKK